MNIRVLKAVTTRAKGYYYRALLQTGSYKKRVLPTYNYRYLLELWPRKEIQCVSNDFYREGSGEVDLSICIPMFNVENCVKTLLAQIAGQISKYTYEVILVDDGSTDATAKIVKDYIVDKPQFIYLYQDNNGIGAARNTAINHSSGLYLSFVDSDDEICDGYIDLLMDKTIKERADIVKGRYCLKRGKRLHQRDIASNYMWGGVYRASLFDKIRFPVGYWYEDMINLFLVEPIARKISNIENNVIFHNDVADSASKKQSKANSYQTLEDLYLVQTLAVDYWKLGIDDASYFAERLITECSYLMVNRISLLDEDTRMQVFLACNELFGKYGIKSDQFSGIERIFAIAILQKDFRAWELAARIH